MPKFEFKDDDPLRVARLLHTEARFIVARVCRVDADSIEDGSALIPELYGLAWALQYLIAAQTPLKWEGLRYESTNNEGLTERFTAKVGRVMTSQNPMYDSLAYGAGPELSIVTPGHRGEVHGELVRKAIIPTNSQLKQIADRDPAEWHVLTVASACADRDPAYAYPFDHTILNNAGPGQYLADVQALSGRLL